METWIRTHIKVIAKQSALVGVDNCHWDVTRISWSGVEWAGFDSHFGYCYVEAFEHANPPHDFIYVVNVLSGVPTFAACYEGDIGYFELTVEAVDEEHLNLPKRVER